MFSNRIERKRKRKREKGSERERENSFIFNVSRKELFHFLETTDILKTNISKNINIFSLIYYSYYYLSILYLRINKIKNLLNIVIPPC